MTYLLNMVIFNINVKFASSIWAPAVVHGPLWNQTRMRTAPEPCLPMDNFLVKLTIDHFSKKSWDRLNQLNNTLKEYLRSILDYIYLYLYLYLYIYIDSFFALLG
jgi:hypothetical protein